MLESIIIVVVVVVLGCVLCRWFRRGQPRRSTFWRFQPVSMDAQEGGEEGEEVWGVMDADPARPSHHVHVDAAIVLRTMKVADAEPRMEEMSDFLCAHYLNRPPNVYAPTPRTVRGVFVHPRWGGGFVTLASRQGSVDHLLQSDLVGMITSRPLTLYVKGMRHMVYYVDMMCVHSDERNGCLARALITTHEKNQRKADPGNLVSVFRREDTLLRGVRPVVSFRCMAMACAALYAQEAGGRKMQRQRRDDRMLEVTAERDLREIFATIQTRKAEFSLLPSTANEFARLMATDHRVWTNRARDVVFIFRDARLTLYKPTDRVATLVYAAWEEEEEGGGHRVSRGVAEAWDLMRQCEMDFTHLMVDLVGQAAAFEPSCAAIATLTSPVQYYMYNYHVPRTLDARLCNIIH